MRAIRVWAVVLAVGSIGNGCSCDHNAGNGNGNGEMDLGINPDAIAGGDLVITPKDVTLDLQAGGAPPSQAYVATTLAGADVTAMTTFTVDDPTLGGFSGATFTASGAHGGTSFVRGNFQGMTGYATVHVKLHATVPSDNCPSCPPFPGPGTPMCTAAAQTPTVLYPPDGTLVPPNMNVLSLQFDQGTGNTYFEIDYENAATDVRVLTMCSAITDSKKNATNGCVYELSQQVWDYIAESNRGGDPLNIIVRATDANGTCIATSQTQVAISFGEEDLNGGIYYWQSVAIGLASGAAGGIFRYDFGKRGQTPQAFLAPTAGGGKGTRCIGCHFLSRDGAKMTFGNDDPDADDEYSDLKTSLLDVGTKAAVALAGNGGFQAFTPDHSLFLASNGSGTANPFALHDGNSGAAASPATVDVGGRGTQPDYSADGSQVVFVRPANFSFPTYMRIDDNHFTGGSLYTMTAKGTSFGTPTPLLTSAGENNYYPAFSPDGAFVVFNRVPLMGTANACVNTSTIGSCPNDAFSNANARIFIMPASGGTPVDLANINGSGPLENSWPRFAPTVQKYKGDTIAWVTFASTRDYGDVVRNSAMVNGMPQHICYPPESPENTSTNKNVIEDPSCLQPQLWMAAINLSKASSGADPSIPAFWLPFQDSTAHNHIAQWVVQLAGPPATGDGGTCLPDGVDCSGGGVCCNGVCCGTTSGSVCGCIP